MDLKAKSTHSEGFSVLQSPTALSVNASSNKLQTETWAQLVSQQPEGCLQAPEAKSSISCVGHDSSSGPRGWETCDCISAG